MVCFNSDSMNVVQHLHFKLLAWKCAIIGMITKDTQYCIHNYCTPLEQDVGIKIPNDIH